MSDVLPMHGAMPPQEIPIGDVPAAPHRIRGRRTMALALAAGLAVTGVACGGDGDAEPVDAGGAPTTIAAEDTATTPMAEGSTECASPPATYPEASLTPEQKGNIVHNQMATVFWIGEGATEDAGFITNTETAWFSDAVAVFGGVDREPGAERDFTPSRNTFYVALPAGEFTETGRIEGALESSPWAGEAIPEDASAFLGRWLKVTGPNGQTAYAQWVDVGPCAENDYDAVFGNGQPTNTFGERAGIDLSPDLADHVGIDGSGEVAWEFVRDEEVLAGPWTTYPAFDNKPVWE